MVRTPGESAAKLEVGAVLARVGFRYPERAAANLSALADQVPPAVAEALPVVLGDSPDPDSALNHFLRLMETAGGELSRIFQRHPFLAHYAIVVFGHSQYLAETVLRSTDLFSTLARDRGLNRSHTKEDFRENFARFRTRSFDSDIGLLLARFKKREYVRIMLRDVLGIAPLAETTAEISALTDVLIEEALRETDSALRARYGTPLRTDDSGRSTEVPFAVLSLGKLGGNELNYSSDVDLLFLYGDGEPETPGAISNREYFIRLAQRVTEDLSRVTTEGSVFRIDLRLRPQGREGEPAVPLRQALEYYSAVAADWELQALIKVRHSAGNLRLAREFIRGVQPHVYKAELNFAALETALETRRKMGLRRRKRALGGARTLDVKRDRGGIRDIEFLVQCLQRVYGGSEPWLRSGGTLFSLQKLHDKGHLTSQEFHLLSSGYGFLRRVEHRLQLRRGEQKHRLPHEAAEMDILGRMVGGEEAGAQAGEWLKDALRERMAEVAEIYQRIVHSQQQFQREPSQFQLRARAQETGPEQTFKQILRRLATDAPAVYEIAARRDLPAHTRRNLQRFLGACFTSSERYAAMIRRPEALGRGLQLFAVSDYLTDLLVRHPEEVETLAEMEVGEHEADKGLELPTATPEAPELLNPVFEYLASSPEPPGEKAALLRRHYRHLVFQAAARDLLERRGVYASLAENSAAAVGAVRAATGMAGGAPVAVLALGRLGTREFDLASDADLLFVRDQATLAVEATRTTERIVEALAAYTREGTVFAVDARLRPRGADGELVTTPAVLEAYFAQEAQPWEALTYTKLRHIAGPEELGGRAVRAVQQNFSRFLADPELTAKLHDIRERLERSEPENNFKTTPGGFYDVDFVAAYLILKQGGRIPRENMRETLRGLAEQGLLSDGDCATLDYAAELSRAVEHAIRLVHGRARKTLPRGEHARRTVERLTARILGHDLQEGLAGELTRTYESVREVYTRILG